jgi:hypothetical protein
MARGKNYHKRRRPWLLEMETNGAWYAVERFYSQEEANARKAVTETSHATMKAFRVRFDDGSE